MFWEKVIKESRYKTVQNEIHKNLWWWRGIRLKRHEQKNALQLKLNLKIFYLTRY